MEIIIIPILLSGSPAYGSSDSLLRHLPLLANSSLLNIVKIIMNPEDSCYYLGVSIAGQ